MHTYTQIVAASTKIDQLHEEARNTDALRRALRSTQTRILLIQLNDPFEFTLILRLQWATPKLMAAVASCAPVIYKRNLRPGNRSTRLLHALLNHHSTLAPFKQGLRTRC